MPSVDFTHAARSATMRRFLAALVTEQLMDCSLSAKDGVTWATIVPSSKAENPAPFSASFKVDAAAVKNSTSSLRFLDPEDILSGIVSVTVPTTLSVDHPAELMRLVSASLPSPPTTEVLDSIVIELESSVRNQELAYEAEMELPTLASHAIDWERAVVEGHPVHPMHRTRIGLEESEIRLWAAEFGKTVDLCFVSMPRSAMRVYGDFEAKLAGWAPASPSPDRIVLPVHPGQLKRIYSKFPQAELMQETQPAYPQTSLRSVAPLNLDHHIKLSLGVQATSALRTISPYSVFNGPRIGALARAIAPKNLVIIDEPATCGSADPTPAVAKHLACIVRDDPERLLPGERIIITGALVERDFRTGEPHITRILNLRTQESRVAFFEKYSKMFLECFLPPLRDHAFAFETHGQNVLARFSPEGELLGFAVRDFGGVRVHLPTLKSTLGLNLELLPGSTIVGETAADSIPVLFHTGIQLQLHRMARALNLHHNDVAWGIVRKQLKGMLSADSPILKRMMQPTVSYKCLLTMRLTDAICDYVFLDVPNVLVSGMETN